MNDWGSIFTNLWDATTNIPIDLGQLKIASLYPVQSHLFTAWLAFKTQRAIDDVFRDQYEWFKWAICTMNPKEFRQEVSCRVMMLLSPFAHPDFWMQLSEVITDEMRLFAQTWQSTYCTNVYYWLDDFRFANNIPTIAPHNIQLPQSVASSDVVFWFWGQNIWKLSLNGTKYGTHSNLHQLTKSYMEKFIQFLTYIDRKKLFWINEWALRDPLTGLPNRIKFYMESNRIITFVKNLQSTGHLPDSYSISTMVFDLDFFKRINEAYGHAGGDAVLAQIWKILWEEVAKEEAWKVVAGRFWGEEFGVILQGFTEPQAEVFAKRFYDRVKNTKFDVWGPEPINVTLTVGVSTTMISKKWKSVLLGQFLQESKNQRKDDIEIPGYPGIEKLPGSAHEEITALLHAADEAVGYWKKHGRDQIMLASNVSPEQELSDRRKWQTQQIEHIIPNALRWVNNEEEFNAAILRIIESLIDEPATKVLIQNIVNKP
jgi:diguanylate cyclase (GGDEF)-like protein